MRPPLTVIASLALAGTLVACSRAPDSDPRMVSEWMRLLYGAVRVERISPPVASRLTSYASAALYSGLATADSDLPVLTGTLNDLDFLPAADPRLRYDGTLAAVSATRVVLDSLLHDALPTTRAQVARLADSLDGARTARGIGETIQADSRDLGQRIGLAIVAWSRRDGFDSTRNRPYVPPVGDGLWINDAPGNTFAAQNQSGATDFVGLDNPANTLRPGSTSDRNLILNRPKAAGTDLPAINIAGAAEPYWGSLRPFVLARYDECPLPPPLTYSTDTSSALYREAQAVYRASRELTPEQRTIALFWADNPGESGTPVGHWLSIASQLVSQRGLSAAEAARLMLTTSVAQADAFIASFGYKYRFNSLRPRRYIRALIDPAWEPAIPNPPFPEHPSAHSAQSAAAATVLAGGIGDMAFEDSTSITLGHTVRRFPSFAAAAEEAGQSRIYGGIHFPSGNIGGRTLGQCIGQRVIDRLAAARAR